MKRLSTHLKLSAALGPVMLTAFTAPAMAQQLPQEGFEGYEEPVLGQDSGEDDAPERMRTEVTPYLELDQTVVADLNGGGDVLTYTSVAAGVDASVQTRRAEGTVSLRYERRIEWDDDIGDEDIVSGIARGSVELVPNTLALGAGAVATRSTVDLRGPVNSNQVGGVGNVTQVYSVYAGPSLTTNIGTVGVNANYNIGYTRVESPDAIRIAPGQPALDVFDDSVTHSANLSVGQQPGVLPFGWSISGGYNREDASQLDQRFEDAYVRADVTVPVSPTVAVVGGVGYEDVKVSERDAVRDANGDPVLGPDGRLVTDKTSPRLLSYDEDGLIWDVGVLWRPSSRTSLEARVGRRYGSTTYTGTFTYQPSANTGLTVSVYDTVSGFGSQLNNSLSGLPTQFSSSRNPLSGELNGCVFGSTGGLCFNNILQSVASSNFRTRGVVAQYSTTFSGWDSGFGIGYNRNSFYAARGGALALANGVIDENYFANFYLGRQIDARSSFSSNLYVNYFDSGFAGAGDTVGMGANAAYFRNIFRGLDASAAVGLESFDQEGFENELIGSAQVGLRYSF